MHKTSKASFKYNGFTLVEMLVVVGIIGLLSAAVFISQKNGRDQSLVTQAAQKLSSDLRRAQSMAMSGTGITGNYYGYGIYLQASTTSYVLYGEVTDTGSDSIIYNPSGVGQDTIIETVNLPPNVIMNSVSFASGAAHIFFKPPDIVTLISDGATSNQEEATVTLKISSATKTVKIMNSGLIQAQ